MLQTTNQKSSTAMLSHKPNTIYKSSYHVATQSALILIPTSARCLPLHYNRDPDKEATSPLMWLDNNVFSQTAEAIVESLSLKSQERLPINV